VRFRKSRDSRPKGGYTLSVNGSPPEPIPSARTWDADAASAGASPPTDPAAQSLAIPDHVLLGRIGFGSYGEVWLARSALGTLRAVKRVRRAAFDDDRPYEREFAGLQKFEPLSRTHEGFVDLLQVGRNDAEGWFYYVMELADDAGSERGWSGKEDVQTPAIGRPSVVSAETYQPLTLASLVKLRGAQPLDDCLRIARTLAGALAELHRHGLVHRDIKPSNLIFVNGMPKLADVGLVAAAKGVGQDRSFVGTEGFIPPEGPGTPVADLYSLGIVLYVLATGKSHRDFPEPPADLATRPDRERERWLEFSAVIHRAAAVDPKQRYASAAALLADLELLIEGKSVKRRRAWRRATKACGVVLGLTLTVWGVALLISRTTLKPAGRGTQDEQAWSYYTQARHFGSQGMTGKSREYLELAVQRDTNFAEAWAGLAGARSGFAEVSSRGPNAVYPDAITAAETAIRLNPRLADPLTVLAGIKAVYGYEQREAERLQRRALELEPERLDRLIGLARILSIQGRTNESVPLVRQALRSTPTGVSAWEGAGHILYEARLYDEAAMALRKGIELHPGNAWLWGVLSMVYQDAGKTNEAAEAWLTNMRLDGRKPEDIGAFSDQ
jgi:tetratricopeptide (TPR) repeat protein